MSVSVNERVNGHAGNGVRKPDDKPVLIANHARDLLNLRRLPAMLTVAQTAVLLNRGEHELADDRQALDRICATLTEYWRGKNENRNG